MCWFAILTLPGLGGCSLNWHYVARDPRPDFIAHSQAPHTVRLERSAGSDPMTEVCNGYVCVRGLRAQFEHGVDEALGQIAHNLPADTSAQYVARIDEIVWSASQQPYMRVNLWLRWTFSLREAASGRVVVRVSDTESAAGAVPSQIELRVQELEHSAVGHIADALARSPLAAP